MIKVFMESEEFGYETFKYDNLVDAFEGMQRLIENAKQDSIERRIGIVTNEPDNEDEDELDLALNALFAITRLGANPITQHGCETRKDFMEHCSKMWQVAWNALHDMGELKDDVAVKENQTDS